ncbi:unnamed protein product [Amaranthus hypochondriacus]
MMQTLRFLVLFSTFLISQTASQDRAPHRLANQSPMAFSPMAYDFFHPNGNKDPCTFSKCSPFPLAAQLHETQEQTTSRPRTHSVGIGAGAVVAAIFAALVIVCLAIGVYNVAKSCQANVNRNKTVQPMLNKSNIEII